VSPISFDAGRILAFIDLDRSPFTAGLLQAKADADAFVGRPYTATLLVEDAEGKAAVDDLDLQLDEFGRKHETATLAVDPGPAVAGLGATDAAAADAGLALGGIGGKAKDAEKAVEDAGKDGGAALGSGIREGTNVAGNAIGNLSGSFGSLVKSFGTTASNISSKLGGVSNDATGAAATLQRVAGGITAVFAAAFVVTAAAGIDLAMKMQSATAAISSAEGISTSAAKAIGNAMLNTAGQVEYSAQEQATAFAGVAGQLEATQGHALTTAQSMQFMHAAMDLATGTGNDLVGTTSNLAKVMQAYAIPTSGAAKASDNLYSASQATGVSVGTLAQALARMHTQMGAATPPLSQASALLIDLAEHGETGRGAMSALGSAFNGIVSPSAAVTKAQQAMGVSFVNAHGQLLPMRDIIGELAPKLDGMGNAQATATLKSLGFGSASSKLVETIKGGLPAYDKASAAANKVGAAHLAAAKQAETLHGEMKTLKATFDDLATRLGQVLIPVIQKLGAAFAKLIGFFMDHKPVLDALGVTIGIVLVAAIGNLVASLAKGAAESVINFGKMVVGATQWAVSTGISIAQTLALWAMYFVEWLAKTATSVATWIAAQATTFATWIAKTATALATQVAAWATYFAGWLAKTATSVATWLAGQATAFASWIAKTATTLATQVAAWAVYFAGWLAKSATAVATWLAAQATAFATWLAKTAASLATQVVAWAVYFAGWLASSATAVGSWIAAQAAAMATWIASTVTALATQIAAYAAYFARWLAGAAAAVWTWAVDMAGISTAADAAAVSVGLSAGAMVLALAPLFGTLTLIAGLFVAIKAGMASIKTANPAPTTGGTPLQNAQGAAINAISDQSWKTGHALGGIATTATLGTFNGSPGEVGEAGPEALLPLSAMPAMVAASLAAAYSTSALSSSLMVGIAQGLKAALAVASPSAIAPGAYGALGASTVTITSSPTVTVTGADLSNPTAVHGAVLSALSEYTDELSRQMGAR